ncbi:MAG: SH3 domain-containing protein [Saprospiraceae bacterium]|nr:SH3 domain-containing protein [Saprospiraceae bacterium]
MRKISSFIILLLLLLGTACREVDQAEETRVPLESDPGEVESVFIVNVENLRLRDKPGQEGKVLTTLQKDTRLVDLEKVSDFNTEVILRGIPYDEPWVLVQTPDSLKGWVFAGGLNFDMTYPSEISLQLMHQRLATVFGKELANSINRYRLLFQNAKRSRDFATALRTGTLLRDSLVAVLEKKFDLSNFELPPNLEWMEEGFPGYTTQLVAEGTQYYLFQNYKSMQPKVMETEGSEDDEFLELCFQVYQTDSIENFYPSWFMQTWDYGGHSLLGRGIHKRILEEIEEILDKADLFEPEILQIKAKLVQDILEPDNTYWESQEKITNELKEILDASFSILSEEEKDSLAARLTMFEAPFDHGIKLDVKSETGNF